MAGGFEGVVPKSVPRRPRVGRAKRTLRVRHCPCLCWPGHHAHRI